MKTTLEEQPLFLSPAGGRYTQVWLYFYPIHSMRAHITFKTSDTYLLLLLLLILRNVPIRRFYTFEHSTKGSIRKSLKKLYQNFYNYYNCTCWYCMKFQVKDVSYVGFEHSIKNSIKKSLSKWKARQIMSKL